MKRILSHIYGAVVGLRNRAYDRQLPNVARVPVPVISVGNITAGGTGKTPVVEYLAAYERAGGRRAAVVTRGYRRKTKGNLLVSDGRGYVATAREGGDEAVQIARKIDGLVVIADEKRSRGCRRAVDEFSVEVIILDDAFQHRGMHRDVDIVVIDSGDDLSTQRLLPAGRLREPLVNLQRADVVVLSKCGPATPVEERLRAIAAHTDAPVFAARFAARRLRRLGEEEGLPLDALGDLPVGSFCGIGNPAGFRQTLEELHAAVVTTRAFPDHYWYGEKDFSALQEQGTRVGANGWITTEKDAVRLINTRGWERLGAVYYPEMEVELLGSRDAFFSLLGR